LTPLQTLSSCLFRLSPKCQSTDDHHHVDDKNDHDEPFVGWVDWVATLIAFHWLPFLNNAFQKDTPGKARKPQRQTGKENKSAYEEEHQHTNVPMRKSGNYQPPEAMSKWKGWTTNHTAYGEREAIILQAV
jgi:hypothetical protein